MRRDLRANLAIAFLLIGVTLAIAAHSQQPAQPQQPDDIPVTDGTSGPCSIEFSVPTLTASQCMRRESTSIRPTGIWRAQA